MKIIIKIGILAFFTLLAVLAIPMVSAQNATYYLVPNEFNLSDCTSIEVELHMDPHGIDYAGGQIGLTYDPSCVNVTNFEFGPFYSIPAMRSWNIPGWSQCWDKDGEGMDTDWLIYGVLWNTNEDVLIGTYTINCSNLDGNCNYCETELIFTSGADCNECPIWAGNATGDPIPFDYTTIAGIFKCGTPSSGETFSKSLSEGWNLISLPLIPLNNGASAVLSTVSYDAVYRYDASSKKFKSIDVMNPGTGYFVQVTSDCIWEYEGSVSNSINVPLEQGLNMVGWMDCTKDVNSLSSVSDYYYIARWNTLAEEFEVYNPVAPDEFNDFNTMDPGTGYFISAKPGIVALLENC